MARLITVDVTCDWPAGCDVRVPEGDDRIVSKTVSIDGKQAREFLICKGHLDEFEAIVLPLMAAGVKVTSGKRAAPSAPSAAAAGNGEIPLDPDHPHVNICQADVDGRPCNRPIRRRVGMAQHVRRAHGYESLEAYEAEFGPVT
jgi:hypothetical protein